MNKHKNTTEIFVLIIEIFILNFSIKILGLYSNVRAHAIHDHTRNALAEHNHVKIILYTGVF